MEHPTCLNCDNPVSKNFCEVCGQRTNTHRIDFKSFFLHDLVHGVWHLDRGILFTTKETFTRPGKAALDYISGKRVRYYNVFYLTLLALGLSFSVSHFLDGYLPHTDEKIPTVFAFLIDNLKWFIVGMIPFIAFNGYGIMDRLHLNLAEHFIIAGICLLGSTLLSFPAILFSFLAEKTGYALFEILSVVVAALIIFFPVYVYANASSEKYRWWELLWRFLLFYTILMIQGSLVASLLLLFW
ncbi:DUF3667 domain-containing protein [Flavobacterium selenitireducens]|uniref:DUF3667 domain-containing protein n=1 Tax=Flavobacterium selenitireducens TaxID=2722704 RepID=UPI00168A9F88|nr:DUF3667 domain-containing protein [Flavobacterium selenitireducens]MBD3581392.1 DUF3667 domain-containing protein [Flavobacterium selenitireducens]